MMFFNRQERDILWCSQLDELCLQEPSKSVLVNTDKVSTDHDPNIQQAKKTSSLPEGRCLSLLVFEVENVLSERTDSWKGRRGRIDACMLQNFLERPEGSKCLVCVCGPTGFTELAVQLVKQLDFIEEEIHIFQG